MSEISLTLRHEGLVTRVVCAGEVIPTAAADFNHVLIMAIGTEPSELHIDMLEVEALSFEGIVALLRAARWCSESEIVFHLEPGPAVSQALRQAGLQWLGEPEEARAVDEVNELILRARAFRRLIDSPSVL